MGEQGGEYSELWVRKRVRERVCDREREIEREEGEINSCFSRRENQSKSVNKPVNDSTSESVNKCLVQRLNEKDRASRMCTGTFPTAERKESGGKKQRWKKV